KALVAMMNRRQSADDGYRNPFLAGEGVQGRQCLCKFRVLRFTPLHSGNQPFKIHEGLRNVDGFHDFFLAAAVAALCFTRSLTIRLIKSYGIGSSSGS